jgi:hypothetical protein
VTVVAEGGARFPNVPMSDGHYESVYLTAHHPTDKLALWVRHTVLKAPGEPATGALWCTWFGADGVQATRVELPIAPPSPPWLLEVGDQARIGHDGAIGSVATDALAAHWDLRFLDPEPPMHHLPWDRLYALRLPRTKSLSAVPHLRLAGELVVDGTTVALDGWTGSVGHNWGTEHAERWIWLRADGFAEDDTAWLDVVIGRIRVGPVLLPWVANGVLSLGGDRLRVGGIGRAKGVRIDERPDGCDLALRGSGLRVGVRVDVDLGRCVAWHYGSASGEGREVVNSSVATIAVDLAVGKSAPVTLHTPVGTYEIGGPARAIDVAFCD